MAGFCDASAESQAKKIPMLRSGSGSSEWKMAVKLVEEGIKNPARWPGYLWKNISSILGIAGISCAKTTAPTTHKIIEFFASLTSVFVA